MTNPDEVITSTDQLRKILDELGMPEVPVFSIAEIIPKMPELSEAEKRQIQIEALKNIRREGK